MQLDKQWLSTKYPWAKSEISGCSLRDCEKKGEEVVVFFQLSVDVYYVLVYKCCAF